MLFRGFCIWFLLASIGWFVECMYVEYEVNEPFEGTYLAKFAFASETAGTIEYAVDLGDSNTVYMDYMLVLLDQDTFDRIDGTEVTCEEIRSIGQTFAVINGSTVKAPMGGGPSPMFYYAFLTACSSSEGIDATIWMRFQNPGGFFYREFSFDKQGIYGTYLCMGFAYLFMSGLFLGVVVATRRWNPLGWGHRLLAALLGCRLMAMIFYSLDQTVYAIEGEGLSSAAGFGDIFTMFAFFSLAGYFIYQLSGHSYGKTALIRYNILLMLAIVLYLFLYVGLFVWGQLDRDFATTIYMYESTPGILLQLLRLASYGYFLYIGITNLRKSMEYMQGVPFVLYWVLSFFWAVSLSFWVLIGLAIDLYYREKTVLLMILLTNGVFDILMIIMFLPYREFYLIWKKAQYPNESQPLTNSTAAGNANTLQDPDSGAVEEIQGRQGVETAETIYDAL